MTPPPPFLKWFNCSGEVLYTMSTHTRGKLFEACVLRFRCALKEPQVVETSGALHCGISHNRMVILGNGRQVRWVKTNMLIFLSNMHFVLFEFDYKLF